MGPEAQMSNLYDLALFALGLTTQVARGQVGPWACSANDAEHGTMKTLQAPGPLWEDAEAENQGVFVHLL